MSSAWAPRPVAWRPCSGCSPACAAPGAFSFVVVQHLSPDFKSVMDELLAPHTELAVRPAEDGTQLEPDTIYLMPAGCEITVRADSCT